MHILIYNAVRWTTDDGWFTTTVRKHNIIPAVRRLVVTSVSRGPFATSCYDTKGYIRSFACPGNRVWIVLLLPIYSCLQGHLLFEMVLFCRGFARGTANQPCVSSVVSRESTFVKIYFVHVKLYVRDWDAYRHNLW